MQAVFLTSQRLITQHWAAAARLLEPSIKLTHGELEVEDLEEMARDGRAVIGLAFEDGEPTLAIAFQFKFYPRFTSVFVLALGGRELRSVAGTFWRHFTEWCQESGIAEIEACAAPAMTRMLRPLGFEHTYNFVRMSTKAAA